MEIGEKITISIIALGIAFSLGGLVGDKTGRNHVCDKQCVERKHDGGRWNENHCYCSDMTVISLSDSITATN